MELIQFFQTHLAISLMLTGLLGLLIGSFLNVVIVRYPIMLHKSWKAECLAFINHPPEKETPVFNLMTPRSHCPNCKAPITAWQNIPLISYIFLKSKCANCKAKISPIYFVVEILSATIAILVVNHFGINWKAFSALILSWSLLALSFIDIKEQILPDTITLSLLWLGLLCGVFGFYTTHALAILGALLGYAFLWAIAKLFKAIRKKEGMGYGDFKMFAMLGAWMGAGALFNILLVAVFIALIISLILLLTNHISKENPVPFGPFLALGGWLTLMYGPMLTNMIQFL